MSTNVLAHKGRLAPCAAKIASTGIWLEFAHTSNFDCSAHLYINKEKFQKSLTGGCLLFTVCFLLFAFHQYIPKSIFKKRAEVYSRNKRISSRRILTDNSKLIPGSVQGHLRYLLHACGGGKIGISTGGPSITPVGPFSIKFRVKTKICVGWLKSHSSRMHTFRDYLSCFTSIFLGKAV